MDKIFVCRLVLSFFVGGIWVTLTTILGDRAGSKIGGHLGGLPSTICIGFLFIGITQGAAQAVAGTTIVPVALTANVPFMITYILLARRGLPLALTTALVVWAAVEMIWLSTHPQNIVGPLVIWLAVTMIAYIILERFLHLPSQGGVRLQYTPRTLAFRAAISGSIIMLAVIAAKIGGPQLGGLLACFPALFTSTIIISHLARGPEFTSSLGKTLLLSGLINTLSYGLGVRYFYPVLGLTFGTITALGLSYFTGFLTHHAMKKFVK